MSRRARLEKEKQRQLDEELEAEEHKIKAQKDRVYAPIIWKRLASGIKIQDLKPNNYGKVLEIIEEFYFSEEVLCRNSKIIEDSISTKSFLKSVDYNLRNSLGLQLMLSAIDVARSLNISVIMGLFTSWSLQKLAKKIKMEVISEVYYVDWRDRFNELIFDDPGVGNYTCAIMAGRIPLLIVEPNLNVAEETVPQLTRREKKH